MDEVLEAPERPYRSLFISDVHLGTRGCQAGMFLDFLREFDADQIYLVGDIVDCWRLKRGWYWPQEHNDIVQKLLRKARKGSRIIYVPGNHDEVLRDYIELITMNDQELAAVSGFMSCTAYHFNA
ncbi:MAG: UDP-2,3-diacylglucosamine diphosphatase, partial [Pseudomonadota bacterium]